MQLSIFFCVSVYLKYVTKIRYIDILSNLVIFYRLYFLLFIAPCDLSDDDMSIVDTTDGDSITSNGVLMVKDKRSKTGYKKASDRKVNLWDV